MVNLVGMALCARLRADVLGSCDVGGQHNGAVNRNAGDKEEAPDSEAAEQKGGLGPVKFRAHVCSIGSFTVIDSAVSVHFCAILNNCEAGGLRRGGVPGRFRCRAVSQNGLDRAPHILRKAMQVLPKTLIALQLYYYPV